MWQKFEIMKYKFLPNTDIRVSEVCLGTMTWGQQNSEQDGHNQLDMALDLGVNFVDTAEMYAVPAREETSGLTEKIIGSWLKKTGRRQEIVLATKIAGPNRGLGYIRSDLGFNAASIRLSVEKSLQRLETDFIDLYQLHWPERNVNIFGQLGFRFQPEAWEDNMRAVLEDLQLLVAEGKIGQIGVSNETPWGLMRFLEESKRHNLPKMITIQNPYSLLNRSFEVGLSEVSFRENVGLLAYSPLGFGVLSGKFLTGEAHPMARLRLYPQFARYSSPECLAATVLYDQIAKANGLSLTQLSMAFIAQQPFVSSTIIGATTLGQLGENIAAFETVLSSEVLAEIEKVHRIYSNPAP